MEDEAPAASVELFAAAEKEITKNRTKWDKQHEAWEKNRTKNAAFAAEHAGVARKKDDRDRASERSTSSTGLDNHTLSEPMRPPAGWFRAALLEHPRGVVRPYEGDEGVDLAYLFGKQHDLTTDVFRESLMSYLCTVEGVSCTRTRAKVFSRGERGDPIAFKFAVTEGAEKKGSIELLSRRRPTLAREERFKQEFTVGGLTYKMPFYDDEFPPCDGVPGPDGLEDGLWGDEVCTPRETRAALVFCERIVPFPPGCVESPFGYDYYLSMGELRDADNDTIVAAYLRGVEPLPAELEELTANLTALNASPAALEETHELARRSLARARGAREVAMEAMGHAAGLLAELRATLAGALVKNDRNVAPARAIAAGRGPVPAVGRPASCHVGGDVDEVVRLRAEGMSKEEWAKIQKKEKDAKKGKNFGVGGARGFQSRSFNSFVSAMEKGEAGHLFAVNPRTSARQGRAKDVPYMQRGGSWDNSDLAGKKGWMKTGFGMTAFNDGKADTTNVKKWTKEDKIYSNTKPDIGIFGTAINWNGKGGADDGVAARAKKNGVSADQQMWRDSGALSKQEIAKMNRKSGAPKIGANINAPEKKFFGLF
ncbi:hypothetical protein JL721_10311 [Aureococcus anophagefferens]|nr:hypothetical protein JL721_10311 [Aureococcus anophagefferens]